MKSIDVPPAAVSCPKLRKTELGDPESKRKMNIVDKV